VDADGRLIGLDTHRLEGVYLAVPATAELRDRIVRLAAGESPSRRTLGVAVAPPRVAARLRRSVGLPERDGLLVRGVEDASPAANAGIRIGDLLVRAAGRDLRQADDLFDVLDALSAESLDLGVVRGVEELTVLVRFDDAPPAEEGSV